MKALFLLSLIIAVPCAMSAILFQLASLNTLSFFQTFTFSMGMFVLMNCAVTLSGKGSNTVYVINKEDLKND